MVFSSKKEYLIHFLGDAFFFVFSLWLALFLRHLTLPSSQFFFEHLIPFFILFIFWFLVFYTIGLYDKQTVISRKKLPSTIINAQVINGIIAVFFFYFSPYFGITPKTNLFLYLVVSSFLIIWWRLFLSKTFRLGKRQSVIVVVTSPELKEIARELEENKKYNMEVFKVNPEEIKEKINQKASLIVADLEDLKVQEISDQFYQMLFSGITFINAQDLYQDLFEKVPLSLIKENWLLKNFYLEKTFYDLAKRVIDFALAFFFFILSLIVYPFVFLAIKIEDRGPVFIIQPRIGQKGLFVNVVKFRSMKKSDKGVWLEEDDERVTKVGRFLRKTRIDELPQLWNVVKGDLSLIGPRPDIAGLRQRLEKEIPYYKIRDLIRPGLSGWAQIKQESPPQSVKETRERLMYDFYYIKNRSLTFDFKIALKTIKILASRAGL